MTLFYVNTIMPTKCWTPISQNHSSSDKLQYLQISSKTSQKVAGFADKEQNLPTKIFSGGCDAPTHPIPMALVIWLVSVASWHKGSTRKGMIMWHDTFIGNSVAKGDSGEQIGGIIINLKQLLKMRIISSYGILRSNVIK